MSKTCHEYKEANHLYRYIAARKNGVLYELNFMRFFIDKENKVNCILKAIQFDRCMDNRSNGGVNYDVETKKCKVRYPTSYQSQKNCLNKILEANKKKSFCYNPEVSFYDKSEDIARAFIEFINECDKWR